MARTLIDGFSEVSFDASGTAGFWLNKNLLFELILPIEISALILFQLISMMLQFRTFFDFSTFASVVNSVVSVASLVTAG